MFPHRVHSAVVALTLPELDTLSHRRARVTRRLEKSIAYLYATGKRPTHVVGRGRIMVAGIETTPFGCCAINGSYKGSFDDAVDAPKRGQRVDSIQYYIVELLDMNANIIELQKKKTIMAANGNESAKNWLKRVGDIFTSGAAGLIGEEDGAGCAFWNFDVCLQPAMCMGSPTTNSTFSFDDTINNSTTTPNANRYGSFQKDNKHVHVEFNIPDKSDNFNDLVIITDDKERSSSPPSSSPKNKRRLIDKRKNKNDKRSELSRRTTVTYPGDNRDKNKYDSQTVNTMCNIFDIIGYDFFKSSCGEVDTFIDVYVDHIVGSEMSSTGFVTFNDLVSVTYANSVLLTHKPNALFVQVAPEPRGEI